MSRRKVVGPKTTGPKTTGPKTTGPKTEEKGAEKGAKTEALGLNCKNELKIRM